MRCLVVRNINAIQCGSCLNVTTKVQVNLDLRLEICKCNTLLGALGNYFGSEVLDGENMFFCCMCIVQPEGSSIETSLVFRPSKHPHSNSVSFLYNPASYDDPTSRPRSASLSALPSPSPSKSHLFSADPHPTEPLSSVTAPHPAALSTLDFGEP